MAARKRRKDAQDTTGDATADTQGCEPSPVPAAGGQGAVVDALLDGLGVPDQAYRLHCRGLGVRAIGARLGIDKDTAQRYVRQVEREMTPRRLETRERLLRAAISRLRGIALETSERLDEATAGDARGAAALLNTRLSCEREIARLQGLYETVMAEDGLTGIQITISRRASAGQPDGPMGTSGDSSEGLG